MSVNDWVGKNKKYAKASGTEANRTQIQPSKPKQEITKITNSQNIKRTYGQLSEKLYAKRWPLSSLNRINDKNTNKRNITENLTPKSGNRGPENASLIYRFTCSYVLILKYPL